MDQNVHRIKFDGVKWALRSSILYSPPMLITLSFLFFILLGSVLLALPAATEDSVATPYLDCLFTSTSATCITGFILYDTAAYWSTFGEIVILFLAQIGGLGFITLATFFLSIAGKKTGLKNMMLAQESLNSPNLHEAVPLIRQILHFVFIVELIGALILSVDFVAVYGPVGFYYGIFHSISAFCNAGFDLFGNNFSSLAGFNGRPLVLYTIGILVVLGSLGFIVWKDIIDYRKNKKMLVHTKIVLLLTGVLLIGGSVVIFLLEQNNTMAGLSLGEKVRASIFLSINCRSGGFSTVDMNGAQPITKLFVSALMFIGGASGSTAGGIKVNTLGIMIVAIICVIRSYNDVVLLKRRISKDIVMKAFSITMLVGALISAVMFIISICQPELPMIDVLFDSVSGFGTVGLSTGAAKMLGPAGKILMIFSMLAGRVGPLSFFLALGANKKNGGNTVYPEGKFVVG